MLNTILRADIKSWTETQKGLTLNFYKTFILLLTIYNLKSKNNYNLSVKIRFSNNWQDKCRLFLPIKY